MIRLHPVRFKRGVGQRAAGLAPALALLVIAGVMIPGAAGAQSLLSSGGIGVPADPLDARTRSLGGVGVGLAGWHLAPTDPAAAAGIFLPSASVTFQPGTVTPDGGVRTGQTRFPLLAASYPLRGNVFSIQLGSTYDQRWELRTEGKVMVGEVEVNAIDLYRSTGNIGRVQVGWARRLSETVAVGATAGSQVGSVQRTFTRGLDPAAVGLGIEDFVTQARWRASGLALGGGVAWDPSELLRVAASFSWTNELRLAPAGGDAVETRSYSMPLEVRGGAMGTLAPGLSIAASVGWADWSKVAGEVGEDEVRSATWTYGAGLEWARAEFIGRTLPIRLGIRSQQLPFHFRGAPASETAFSAGVGLNLVDVQELPAARVELGVEQGDRTAGDFSERFLRVSFSVRLAGG